MNLTIFVAVHLKTSNSSHIERAIIQSRCLNDPITSHGLHHSSITFAIEHLLRDHILVVGHIPCLDFLVSFKI